MNIARWRLGLVLVLSILALGLAASAQSVSASESVRMLVVDETKTFLSTMRVGGLVGALKGTGLFEVDVRFADVESDWEDPFHGQWADSDLVPYDIVLVVPRGIDDATATSIWLLSAEPTALSPSLLAAVELTEMVAGQVFDGIVQVAGVHDDLLLGILVDIYVARGWMR